MGGNSTFDQTHGSSAAQRELRIALVCYGRASLAVYMHGQTKELHRLVKGVPLTGRGESTSSRNVYADLIDEMQEAEGVGTQVVEWKCVGSKG